MPLLMTTSTFGLQKYIRRLLSGITDHPCTFTYTRCLKCKHNAFTALCKKVNTHTHTHSFNGPFPGLPRWAGTRKVKPIWILLKQQTVSGSGISWAICKSAPCLRQITTPTPHHSVFYRFLPPNQQRQSTEGTKSLTKHKFKELLTFVCTPLCTTVVHNTARSSFGNIPPSPLDTVERLQTCICRNTTAWCDQSADLCVRSHGSVWRAAGSAASRAEAAE